jgi:TRAP-type C4-dicarboxylate transport system permease small subunit
VKTLKLIKLIDDKIEIGICVVLMTLMAIIIFIQVFMRYVMSNSLVWSEELARYLFVWLIYIGISYGAKTMKHIKIEASLGLFPDKIKPFIVIIGDMLFLGFSLFISFTAFGIVQKQIGIGQTSPAMHLPMWIVYAAPMIGFALTSIRQVQTIMYRVHKLKQGGEIDG